jgi:hypothetical protein
MHTIETIAPYVVFLGLLFILNLRSREWSAVLPEIRALRESVEALRAEIKARDENR